MSTACLVTGNRNAEEFLDQPAMMESVSLSVADEVPKSGVIPRPHNDEEATDNRG